MLNEIFKAYDVRGIYGENLTEQIAYDIGKAFVTFLRCKKVVVGTDMRLSSPKLSKALMKGITDQGADAILIGEVCTDAVYFASGHLNQPGVMFTASHNPPQYNGLKFCKKNAVPINKNTGLQKIKSIIEKKQYGKARKPGKIIKKDVLKDYVRHVHKFIDVRKLRKLKIAVDAGNGMAGKIIPLVFKRLTVKIVPLYFKLDGSFPNHPADPSKYENLVELQKAVREKHCDFGMAFDGDADRIFFVDENGNVINSSLISSMIIKSILLKNKKQKVIHNIVCSHIVPDTIKKYGGKVIVERVGHSFIKDTMRKTKAIFACEHSAHYYYKENYRADSGMITSLIVAEIISKENKLLSELLNEFRRYSTIEETNAEVQDKSAKLKEIESIYKKQDPNKISKLDGVTVEFDNWWFNVRPSNTEPLLRLNLEANSKDLMEEKKEEVLNIMRR
ncbi:phosphomannomutase/phosphoglucomutase [Candidatus Woesearchaeota archaeon]|jgi:phosphomannomutase|nr:phosphomannomutase/phosphoglucomutase [Candidatus Woesearchaeota archaeon]|tara:strand:- start:5883 stop:7223 length:1341 start_codon:yes stop_codon:yes gene_type:complete